jgi:hypothetical protein
MSRDGSISFVYGDGEHRFRLAIGGLRELEEKCKAGCQEIFLRIAHGRWRIDDLRETIRLGLIGGGMPPAEAHILMTRYFDPPERPKLEAVEPAMRILQAALVGVEDEPMGKAAPAGGNATTVPPTEEPSGPESTAPEPPSDSGRARSINGASGNSLQ